MKVLVLTAMLEEAKDFFTTLSFKPYETEGVRCWKHASKETEVFLAHTGIGTEEAAITVTALILQIRPDIILMCGTAGGIASSLEIGDLIIGEKIIHMDLHKIHALLTGTPFESCLQNPNTGELLEIHWESHPHLLALSMANALPRMQKGMIVSSNIFPAPQHLFAEMVALGCHAIDMEAAGVNRAARRFGKIPVLTIRAISNLLDETGADRGTPENGMDVCSTRLAEFLKIFLIKINETNPHFTLTALQ
ncbi:MAG TPA: 5'-methylthioadenosine/S-adenosylhomocysteine nucleosidase [Coxiellaceae bacterium]|nr:5'-methylthioadenosine/S-adenosylhomocysteine nucleosidase [Coxiellaceae bacterium]